jgi:hypothetical protein
MGVNRWAVGIASCLVWSVMGLSSAAAGESDALIQLLIKKGLITEQELAQVEGELAAQQTQAAKPSAEAPRTLEERLAKLEKDVGDKSVIHVGQGTLKVGGLFQGWAFWDGNDNDRFRIRRTELKFAGDILGDERFKYTVMIDPAQVTEDGTRKSVLQDAYFTLAQIPYLPHHAVQLGQYKVPSEEEGNRSSAKLDFAERSFIGRNIGDKRDIGAMLTGTWPYADYSFGIFNGDGQNTSDTNDQKDLAAKVVLKPLAGVKDWGSLEFDVFGYHRPNPELVSEKKRLGWGARYEWQRLSLKSAYVLFQDAAAIGNGWYGQAGYFLIPKRLQAVARFEGFDPNEGIANNAERDLSLGLNYFIDKHNAKAQLNWVHRDEQGDEVSNDQVIGAFQYAF